MDLTSEQRDLRDAVRGLLARQQRQGEGSGRSLWPRLCGEIGAAGLAIPERYGGAGAGPAETHIVMEELGRALTPSPLLGSAVLAAQTLLATGDEAACQRLLPAIGAGAAIAAVAWTGPAGHWDPGEAACEARFSAGGWALTGEAHYVLDGDVADVLLAAARTPDGIALFEVDPLGGGATRTAVTAMDTTRRLAVVRLSGAAGQRIGTGGGPVGSTGDSTGDSARYRTGASSALARARDLACIALSAEQVGAAQRALELTVAHTKTRVQFGQAIGGFQALQHRMADLHVLVESARALSYATTTDAAAADAATTDAATTDRTAAGDAPDLRLRAAAAKAYCSEVLLKVAGEMIQLHGAIGITWEHDAHRYLKRAHGAAQLFGQPAEHIARIATAVLGS
jgi:alkylation response protein AidB-like acyl-CoA dehydrogenase